MKNKVYELYALEQLVSGGTCIHRLHPLVKLFATVLFIVTVVSFNRYSLGRLIQYIIYPALLMALSETPYSILLKRVLIALPFCLFTGIGNVILDRTIAFEIGGIIISNGVISLVTILFRTYLCVMAVLILVSVTPLAELTREMRNNIPRPFRPFRAGLLIVMFEMTYRYIGVLLNELYSMNIAYSLRSRKGTGIRMRDMGSFTGQLLIRSFDRADRVYNAMKCRGYNSGYNPGYTTPDIPKNSRRLTPGDIIFLLIISLYCVSLRVIDINKLYLELFGNLM